MHEVMPEDVTVELAELLLVLDDGAELVVGG
mgnify:CR=1 FL=1